MKVCIEAVMERLGYIGASEGMGLHLQIEASCARTGGRVGQYPGLACTPGSQEDPIRQALRLSQEMADEVSSLRPKDRSGMAAGL